MKINYYFSFVLLVSAFMLVYIGYFSWKRNKLYISISLFPVSIYALGYAFEILCTSIERIKLCIKIEYLGIAFLPVAWLIFAIIFNGHMEKIKKRTLLLLFIVPVSTLIMNYTNDFHHLFYKNLYMDNNGIFPIVEIVEGPWYFVNIVYTYSLMIIGLIIFIFSYFKVVSIIKKQIGLLIIAWITPWFTDIIYILKLLPFHVDLCPLAFCFSGIISSYAILNYKLVKLTPIALEKVFSNMIDGVIILDSENNIVNLNEASRNIILELNRMELGYKKIDEVFRGYEELLKTVNSDSHNETLISIENNAQLWHYRININNIYENSGGIIGKILIFKDVTEQKKNEDKIIKLLKLKEAMIKVGYSINEITNINDLLQLMLDEVINCVDHRSCGSVLLLDKDNNLKIAVAKGYDSEEIKTFTVKLEDHLARFNNGKMINETVIFNGIDKIKDINMLDTSDGIKVKSALSSPIIIDGELYGFLNIDSKYDNIFDQANIELMEYIRNQASSAITRHRLYEETLYLSRYDKLTNVYNRSYFEQLLYEDICNNAEEKEFFLAVFDLNGLKFVNDNFGHLYGDELIKTFSRGLLNTAEDFDIIGRFGGDEFVGVFFNIDFKTLINRFDKLNEHFQNSPIILQNNKIVCSFSYGVVNFPRENLEFNELIKIADERMYENKRLIKTKITK